MSIDLDKIEIWDKVKYINEAEISTIYTEEEAYEFALEDSDSDWEFENRTQDLDANRSYYEIDSHKCPIECDESYINELFEDNLDEIIKCTDIKQDYPELFEDVEIER